MLAFILALVLGCAGTKQSETDTGTDSPSQPPADPYCGDLGFDYKDFVDSSDTVDFGQTAPDFTVPTVNNGDWTLSEHWTGCDTYTFVNYYESNDYPVNLGSPRKVHDFLVSAPRNTHYFILLYPESGQAIDTTMTNLWAVFVGAYNMLEEDGNQELADWWRTHIHFVNESAWDADWIGQLNNSYQVPNAFILWSFAIDQFQIIREVGSYCDPATGWETCPPEFMALESVYFNFEAQRHQQMTADDLAYDTEIISVFNKTPVEDPGWAGARTAVEVTLPDATRMADFDTLELDLLMECRGYPAGTECPPWDYLVHAYLCDADDPATEEDESTSCSTELGRWITTYWRPGRWVHDATPMLALLQDGGTRKIQFYSQQYYELTMDLRFSARGKGHRPVAMERIFDGGAFNDRYNWGQYHSIDDSEWRMWTIPEEVDVFSIVSANNVTADRSVGFGDSGNTDRLIELLGLTFTVNTEETDLSEASDEGQVLQIGTALLQRSVSNLDENGAATDEVVYGRLDYTYDDIHLRLCLSESAAATESLAEAAVLSCAEDDPTSCESLIDVHNYRSGCLGRPWMSLTPDETAMMVFGRPTGTWIESRAQQYLIAENGASNARHSGKFSRLDWTIHDEGLVYCHSITDAGSAESIEAFLESCPSDDAATSNDESLWCFPSVNSLDQEQGCNGGGWSATEDTVSLSASGLPSGELTEIWHSDKMPRSFVPPTGTTKIDVVAVVSGHGYGSDTANCAEFCDHQHQFQVNGSAEHTKTHPEAGTPKGCVEQVAIGTVPNQSGTWVYGRGGWCPGMEVPFWSVDVTDDVNLASSNEVSYLGLMSGEIYHPVYTSGSFNPRIDLRSYIVYYQ